MIDAGRGSFELTGLTDEDVIGRPVQEVLGLEWIDQGDGGEAADTTATASPTRSRRRSSGACARSASASPVNAEGDLPAEAVADVFPAYDDDGGLLLVLTPE